MFHQDTSRIAHAERAKPRRLERATHVATAEQTGRTIVLDLRRGRYFGLDSVGTRVWELLATPTAVEELVSRLSLEYDVSRSQLEGDVDAFVRKLIASGLARWT